MYKCTECGQEFKNKPDYCDCGNDMFEEIEIQAAEPNPKDSVFRLAVEPTVLKEEKVDKKFDAASLIIFFTCIILSILSIVFIGKDSSTNKEPQKTKNVKSKENSAKMPQINEIWTENQPQIEQPAPEIIEEKKIEIKPEIQPPPVIMPSVSKQSKPIPTKPKQVQAKPSQTVLIKPKLNIAAQKQELVRYKMALRNKIASNVNFAAIIGDGQCTVSFKIDSSGNLKNRAFVSQSDNDSVNDIVYGAMMQNPTFKAPPVAYKNETIRLTVKMYGGSYEVDIN